MNRQQLLSRLAGYGWTVVYSTGPWKVWDRFNPDWQRAPFWGRMRGQDGVIVDDCPRWLMRWPGTPGWDRAALGLAARRWRRAMDRAKASIGYIFHPHFLPCALSARVDHLVYHAFDLLPEPLDPQLNAQRAECFGRAELLIG